MNENQPLHVRYRPSTLKEVVGQDSVVSSLKTVIAKKDPPHTFLFTGPSGTGKTTLARIIAKEFHCSAENTNEINAADTNGIDDIRALMSTLMYTGFGDFPNKAVILDECHQLSKAAWNALLKITEEAPSHVYFFFCTTETGKVMDTIQTRAATYNLKSVRRADIQELLEYVADKEKFDVSNDVLNAIAEAADGSPRKALVFLSQLSDCESVDEAQIVLEQPTENKEIIDLCRLLFDKSLDWKKAMNLLGQIPDTNPESIRIMVTNYFASCAIKARSEGDAGYCLDVLHAFSKPCNPTDKMAPILLALGEFILS